MLEVRNLTKTYKPKKGVPVNAVNGVSLKFADKGMVFLIGKSGSGKSTLLNLLGGLDKSDFGEIVINGQSSANFSQSEFDSYRNTYLGFIFQEYNILDEFTVGANIALALELQGRKATDEELNRILGEVDLEGYGARRPNELSGGQKQRVAIARALVKNPEIILADEPTGALDSATGRQVLDTLKKLSKDKLVIVVSHDEDFAEAYADRIIRLADGNVISDIEFAESGSSPAGDQPTSGAVIEEGGLIRLPEKYHLTEQDVAMINAYLAQGVGGVTIEAVGVGARRSRSTDQDAIVASPDKKFRLIKSRLPLKNAFRIGISGMKFKKFRLVITILLSCVAFSLFGLSDVFSAYDYTTTAVSSMIDSKIEYATLMKQAKGAWGGDAQLGTITKKELDELSKSLGVQFGGVFTPPESMDFSMYFAEESDARQIIVSAFCGFAEADETTLKSYGYKLLCGSMPNGARDEILVSDAVAYSFKGKTLADQAGKSQKIATAADMVGKKINFADGDYTVTGVFDTGFDIAKYERLNKQIEKEGSLWTYGQIQQMALTVEDSLCSAALTGKGFIQRKAADYVKYARSLNTVDYRFEAATDDWYSYEANEICYYTKLSSVDRRKIVWANGEKKSLAPGEIILSLNTLTTSLSSADSGNAPTMEDLQKLISTTNFSYKEFATDSKGVSHEKQSVDSIKVVGIYDDSDGEALPDGIHCLCIVNDDKFDYQLTPCSELYNRVIGTMPTDRSGIEKIMKYCRAGKKITDTHYTLENPVINELSMTDSTIKTLAKIFLYIGLGFAVFAAIMLANFIATSISRKKREIGILRAIGSRSADVFRIFFSEAFVIAMINFLLSAILVGVAVVCINSGVRQATGLMLTLLTFGVRQVALVLLVSVVVAALACFLPVRHIAAKRPIDAIRDR